MAEMNKSSLLKAGITDILQVGQLCLASPIAELEVILQPFMGPACHCSVQLAAVVIRAS